MAKFAVREASEADRPGIEALLTDWLAEYNPAGYPAEVRYRMDDLLPDAYAAAVVTTDERIVGVAMLHEAIAAELAAGLTKPIEIVSVYIHRDCLGRGAGHALVRHLEETARRAGFTDVIACSGPRNAEFGYPFWTRRYGVPTRTDADYWAPGAERVVWHMSLSRPESAVGTGG